jgi:hypothetical protein
MSSQHSWRTNPNLHSSPPRPQSPLTPINQLDTTDHATPLTTTMTPSPTILLTIFSHAHTPPLHPPPDLKYDLRPYPSPDRQARKAGDGRSKALRDWLVRVRDGIYVRLLDSAQKEVESRGEELVGMGTGAGINASGAGGERIPAEDQPPSPKMLRVGVFCEMGRHRSVAFVEELSRRKWPREWEVEVVHRDVDKRRKKEKGRDKSRFERRDD